MTSAFLVVLEESALGQGYFPHAANIVYHLEVGGISLKPQEITITALYTKDAPDIQEIILNSLAVFLKKELGSIANLPHHNV